MGGSPPTTIASALLRLASFDDALADVPGPQQLRRDLDVLVLLADVAGPIEGAAGLLLAIRRQLGVDRIGQRHLDHVDDLEPALLAVAVGLLGGGGGEAWAPSSRRISACH